MMQYPMANTLVIRQVAATLRDSCYSDLKWATYRLHVDHLWDFTSSPMRATYRPTGQQIFFRGLDDAQKLASISCIDKVGCYMDNSAKKIYPMSASWLTVTYGVGTFSINLGTDRYYLSSYYGNYKLILWD